MSDKSSIYHFYAELLTKRGYFAQKVNLEMFEGFPDSLIAGKSVGKFPDLVLRHDPHADPQGGDFIELKTAESFSISSFNSTPPSAQKNMAILSKTLQQRLHERGEKFELSDLRDVYYLLVGRKDSKPAPLTKVCLVYGSFFETVPLREVLLEAGTAALSSSSGRLKTDLHAVFEEETAEEIRGRFAETRTIEGSGMKIRFRAMFWCKRGSRPDEGEKIPAHRKTTRFHS